MKQMLAVLLCVALSGGCMDSLDSTEYVGDVEQSIAAVQSTRLLPLLPVSIAPVGNDTFVAGPAPTKLGDYNMRVGKYASDGTTLMAKAFGSAGDDWLDAMDANATGFAITGTTDGPVNFGGGAIDGVAAIARFDSAGNHQWSLALTAYTTGSTFAPIDIAVAPNGSVAVLGNITGAIDFGGTIAGGCSGGGTVPVIAYYGSYGGLQWVSVGNNPAMCTGHAPNPVRLRFDTAGNIVYAGNHRFGFTLGGCNVGGSAYHQPHVMRISPAGTCVWAQQWPVQGDVLHASLHDMSVSDTSIVLSGRLPGGIAWLDFGGGPLTGNDNYLVRLDASGNHAFSTTLEPYLQVAAASDGRVFATGAFTGTLDLGGGPLISADQDIFVAEFSDQGAHIDSALLLSKDKDQEPFAIELSPANAPRVIGNRKVNQHQYFLSSYWPELTSSEKP